MGLAASDLISPVIKIPGVSANKDHACRPTYNTTQAKTNQEMQRVLLIWGSGALKRQAGNCAILLAGALLWIPLSAPHFLSRHLRAPRTYH